MQAAKRSRTETLAVAEAMSAPIWDPRMQGELERQIEKRKDRKAVAAEDGVLLASEVDDELRGRVREVQSRRLKTDREAAAQAKKVAVATAMRNCNELDMAGWQCHVALDCQGDSGLNRALIQLRLRRVADMSARVGVFVRKDPTTPGQRASWIAALTGAWITVPAFIVSKGQHGACVAHSPPAIQQSRRIWVSENFANGHAQIVTLLREAARRPGSKWTTQPTRAGFLAAKGFLNLGFVTLAEKRLPEFAAKPNAFTVDSFLPWIAKHRGGHNPHFKVGDCRS